VLEAAFNLLEFPSPSRRIFIGSHSLPPSLVCCIGPSHVHITLTGQLLIFVLKYLVGILLSVEEVLHIDF
jgi:hypothetical protein